LDTLKKSLQQREKPELIAIIQHISFMRYTGQWIQIYTDLTVDECIETVRDDPYFSSI